MIGYFLEAEKRYIWPWSNQSAIQFSDWKLRAVMGLFKDFFVLIVFRTICSQVSAFNLTETKMFAQIIWIINLKKAEVIFMYGFSVYRTENSLATTVQTSLKLGKVRTLGKAVRLTAGCQFWQKELVEFKDAEVRETP